MNTFSITLIILLFSCPIFAQDTWDGSASTDWGTAANWTDNSVPTSSDNVIIPGSLSNYPVVDETTQSLDLTIQDGAKLTINTGANLTVYDDFFVGEGISGEFELNGGTVTIIDEFRSEVGCTIDINGGILNIGDDWEKSAFGTTAKGTIELSGGIISVADDCMFSSSGVTGSMTGDFQLTVGDDFANNNNGWSTVTGGSVILTGSGSTAGVSIYSTNGLYDLIVNNLTINGSGISFDFSSSSFNAGVIIKNNLTFTAGTIETKDLSTHLDKLDITGIFSMGSGAHFKDAIESTDNYSVGSFSFDAACTYEYYGGTQTFHSATYGNVTVSAGNDKTLDGNVTINGTLSLTGADVDLNGYTITLGSNATINESSGYTINGSTGSTTITKTLSSPSSVNVGGLGSILTSSSDLGSTVVTRGHTVQTGGGNSSIERFYDITPTNNSGLDATLVFSYEDSELNGLTEANLILYKSVDGGTTWTQEGGTINTTDNTVTLTGIDSFSRWTLGSTDTPLPVELVSFSALQEGGSIILRWETAYELNNHGFEIERKVVDEKRQTDFGKIGFLEGVGNSNEFQQYTFEDKNYAGGSIFKYRLKQVDVNGNHNYSEEVTVQIEIKKYELFQNYPNPFNPITKIRFMIPQRSNIELKVYDVAGREIITLMNEMKDIGSYEVLFDGSKLSSGVYIYRLKTGSYTAVKKMLLIK